MEEDEAIEIEGEVVEGETPTDSIETQEGEDNINND